MMDENELTEFDEKEHFKVRVFLVRQIKKQRKFGKKRQFKIESRS